MIRGLVYLHGYDDGVDTWDDPAGAVAPPGATVVRVPGTLRRPDGTGAWFETDERTGPDAGHLGAALAAVDAAVTGLEAEGLARREVALVGFSQGAATSLLWGRVTAGEPIGAVAAIAGWFPEAEGFDPYASPGFAAARVLVAAGHDDEDVPALLSRSAAKVLGRDGVEVELVELEAGHDPRPFVPAVRHWLARPPA